MDHLEWSSADGNYTMSVPAEAWPHVEQQLTKQFEEVEIEKIGLLRNRVGE